MYSLAYYFFLKLTTSSSRIICIEVRWNLLGQVGGAPKGRVYFFGKFWLMTILALPDLDNRSLELLVT